MASAPQPSDVSVCCLEAGSEIDLLCGDLVRVPHQQPDLVAGDNPNLPIPELQHQQVITGMSSTVRPTLTS